jgi:hypothetical protein
VTSNKRVFDAIVQTSTIELFRSYDVAVAPTDAQFDPRQSGADVGEEFMAGGIPISGSGAAGELLLAVPTSVLAAMGHGEALAARDWIRELANQLLGRVKNRLIRYEIRLRPGSPFLLEGHALERRLQTTQGTAYGFRSLRGPVFVILNGVLVPEALSPRAGDGGAEEGDLIVF